MPNGRTMSEWSVLNVLLSGDEPYSSTWSTGNSENGSADRPTQNLLHYRNCHLQHVASAPVSDYVVFMN